MRTPCAIGFGSAWLLASPALASEATDHGGHIPVAMLVFSAINLLLFLWILGRYVMPAVRRWVQERRAQVVNALQAAATAKAEAEALRAQWEARLAQIQVTIDEIRAQAQADAARERDRILAAAQQTAETIRRDAERAAAYEVRRTQERLRAALVGQALRLAEETARAQWSPADQQRFVTDFLKQVQA